jgi:hypothetical protein
MLIPVIGVDAPILEKGIDSKGEMEARFGFMLNALDAGAPPHGGFAFGLDRIAMLLAGAESLRDVIAFPKTQRGQDLLMDAPSAVEPGQLDELHLRIAPAPGPAGRNKARLRVSVRAIAAVAVAAAPPLPRRPTATRSRRSPR